MKIYTPKNRENGRKSWSLRLMDGESDSPISAKLVAVDSEDGSWVADLIIFHEDGTIQLATSAKEAIECNGMYDADEHGNTFDSDECIVISPEKW